MMNYSIFMKIPTQIVLWGRNIHVILDSKLRMVQEAMERELASITLEDVRRDTEKYIGTK